MKTQKEQTKKEVKEYKVLVSRYPEEINVTASNEEEARELAKAQVKFSVWETEVEEVE